MCEPILEDDEPELERLWYAFDEPSTDDPESDLLDQPPDLL